MKKYIPALCLAVVTAAIIGILAMKPQYTITEPYKYPMPFGSDEYMAIGSYEHSEERARINAVPDEIIEKMTTEALVWTVGTYPEFIGYTSGGVFVMDTMHGLRNSSFGFMQLIRRDDLTKAMHDVFLTLDDDWDRSGTTHMLIEIIAGQYTTEYGIGSDEYHEKLVSEIEKYYETHSYASLYEMIVDQHDIRKKVKHLDDTIFDW